MKSEQFNLRKDGFPNRVLHGDCVSLLSGMASNRFDFVLTDPPYLASYVARDGRSVNTIRKAADASSMRVATRTFRYRLLMPGDPDYSRARAILDKRWTGPSNEMQRISMKIKDLRQLWPALPFK